MTLTIWIASAASAASWPDRLLCTASTSATQWATSVCEPHLDQVQCGRRLRMDNASLEKKSSAAALFVFAAPDITQLPLTTVLQWIPCSVRHKQMGYISYKFSVLEVALSIWNFSSYPKRNCFIRTLKDFSQDILPKEEFLYKNSPRFLTGHLSSVAHPIYQLSPSHISLQLRVLCTRSLLHWQWSY